MYVSMSISYRAEKESVIQAETMQPKHDEKSVRGRKKCDRMATGLYKLSGNSYSDT